MNGFPMLPPVTLKSKEKIRKNFEIPVSPISPTASSASTLWNGALEYRRPSTKEYEYAPSSMTAGEVLMRFLYGSLKVLPTLDFCATLVKEYGSGRKVDLPSLALVMKPIDGKITAQSLDGYLFKTEAGLPVHPFARQSRMPFVINNTLSSYTIEFLKNLISRMEIETAEQRMCLGLAYYHGTSLPQDYRIAYKLFISAGESIPEALAYVGICMLHGRGVERGDSTAFHAFKAAAKKRDPLGMYYLSKCYAGGVGCDIERSKSEKWLERAAETYPIAQLELANKLVDQKNPDFIKGIDYFKRAAVSGLVEAQYAVGCCYRNGFHTPQNYNEAIYWFSLASEQGHAPSQNNVAFLYQNGLGCEQDSDAAFYHFQLAAKKHYPQAQLNLGVMYENGQGTEKNPFMAFNLYTLAADADIPEAQHRLALCYQYGIGTEYDLEKMVFWYEKAVQQQYPPSMNNLALYYELVKRTKEDIAEAVKLLVLASEKGDVIAQFNLGDLYETGGQGVVPTDSLNAKKYFVMAATQGDTLALERENAIQDITDPSATVRNNVAFFKVGML